MLSSKHCLNEKKGQPRGLFPFFSGFILPKADFVKKTSSDVDEVFLVGVVGLEPMTSTMSR